MTDQQLPPCRIKDESIVGSGAVIYPELTLKALFLAAAIVPAVTVLGAIYPGYKAVQLEPASQLQKLN